MKVWLLIQQGFVEESSENVKSYGCLGKGSKLGLMIWEQYFKNSEKILWSFLDHYSKQLISFWLIYGTQESQPRMNVTSHLAPFRIKNPEAYRRYNTQKSQRYNTQESQRYILKNNFSVSILLIGLIISSKESGSSVFRNYLK